MIKETIKKKQVVDFQFDWNHISCSPFLTCHLVGDLKKPGYGSHVIHVMLCHEYLMIWWIWVKWPFNQLDYW